MRHSVSNIKAPDDMVVKVMMISVFLDLDCVYVWLLNDIS